MKGIGTEKTGVTQTGANGKREESRRRTMRETAFHTTITDYADLTDRR